MNQPLVEIEESTKIINKAFGKVIDFMDEYSSTLDKILKKEIAISKLITTTKGKKKVIDYPQYYILSHQISKLEIEGEKFLLKIQEAERELLSIPNLDEHIECITKHDRETANNLIRTINLMRFDHVKEEV